MYSGVFLLFIYGCSGTVNKASDQELRIDSAICQINYPAIMKEAAIGNGFEYFQVDSSLYLAYFHRRDQSLIVKNIFDTSVKYSLNLSEQIPLEDEKMETLMVFGFANNSFFFFPTPSPVYYSITFDDFRQAKKELHKVANPGLSIFDKYAFVSKSPEVPLAISDKMVFFPYKLQNTRINSNWIDTTAIILLENFQEEKSVVKKICKYPAHFLTHYDELISQIFAATDDGMVLYATNKKSDSIERYDVQSGESIEFKIPDTHNVDFDVNNKEGLDYTRKYLTQNDVNLKLFPDINGDVYLIRKKPSEEKNKEFEIMYFNKKGDLKSNLIIKNKRLNVTMSFFFKNKIYIPSAASNYYYIISLDRVQ